MSSSIGVVLRLRQQLVDQLHPIVDPLQELVEDQVGKRGVALQGHVVQLVAIDHEAVDVLV